MSSQTRVTGRVWGTLYPPRLVTAIMVAIYLVSVWMGVQAVINAIPPHNIVVWFAAVAMCGGGLTGAVSAWKGAYWLEGPMALSVSFGAFLVVLSRIQLVPQVEHFPITIPMALIIALFFLNRVVRIWPRIYPADRDPRAQSEVAVALAKEEYDRARETHR